jgi:hypothetical protein
VISSSGPRPDDSTIASTVSAILLREQYDDRLAEQLALLLVAVYHRQNAGAKGAGLEKPAGRS